MNENLYSNIRASFPADASRPFLETEGGIVFTYADFASWTGKYAAWLAAHGIRAGDRVLVQAEKSAHLLLLCHGCIRMGAVFVPVNPNCRRQELRLILGDSEPSLIVCGAKQRRDYDALQAEARTSIPVATVGATGPAALSTAGAALASRIAAEDAEPFACAGTHPAALMYTSGTTGRPKAAVITHRNIAANAQALKQYWRWSESDVLLHTLPLFHLHGLFVAIIPTLLSGARIILQRKFLAPAVIAALPRATVFMGVPTYFTRLLASRNFSAATCASIRLFISGSAPLPAQTFREFQQRTGHGIIQRYGMTETGGIASTPVEGPRAENNVGSPLPGFEIRIGEANGKAVPEGEVGELMIRGESVFSGYWRRPEETAAAFTAEGFFRSGDLGRRLSDGTYSVVGRAKDIIITGGMNVNPLEVEAALDACPGVLECAVIGVPHPDYGEAVVAAVVMKSAPASAQGSLQSSELLAKVKKEIAAYKLPRRILFVDRLPRNPMGKVQKHLLRAEARFAELYTGSTR